MYFIAVFESMHPLAKLVFIIFFISCVYFTFEKPILKFYHKHFTKPETIKAELRVVKKILPFMSEENKTPEIRRPGDTYLLGFRTEDRRNKFFEVSWQMADILEENTVGMLTFHWKSFLRFTDVQKMELKEGEVYHHVFFRTDEELKGEEPKRR